MQAKAILAAILLTAVPIASAASVQFVPAKNLAVPPVQREFRGAWIATVNNIDWPSKPGLSTVVAQRELRAIITRAAELNLNALIFQVRPACDALYASKLEPWSEYLTGKMGKAPNPAWDPLAFAITEAHKRGLELHAWFNPYRARYKSPLGSAADSHISKTQPALVKSYAGYQWMDPADPKAAARSLEVILDVVRRYAVDGVHIDDYFYPYPVKGADGKWQPFPDDASWKKYRGKLSRADWRRSHIDRFVQRMYTEVKKIRPTVKVGISPFGIWRPGYPKQIKGLDAYNALYADARKWLREGWMDYCAPQLYWRIEPKAQSYPVLLDWWSGENKKRRHLWPGNNSAKAKLWKAEEFIKQIGITRKHRGTTGNTHWNVSALTDDLGGLATQLQKTTYRQPALIPTSPWLDKVPPRQPQIQIHPGPMPGKILLDWRNHRREPVVRWTFQIRVNGQWSTMIFPGSQQFVVLNLNGPRIPDAFALIAIDRAGNASSSAVFKQK